MIVMKENQVEKDALHWHLLDNLMELPADHHNSRERIGFSYAYKMGHFAGVLELYQAYFFYQRRSGYMRWYYWSICDLLLIRREHRRTV